MVNLRGVDLNLLPVFEAAYEERSLARAATRLAMTQPAVSPRAHTVAYAVRAEGFVRRSRALRPSNPKRTGPRFRGIV